MICITKNKILAVINHEGTAFSFFLAIKNIRR